MSLLLRGISDVVHTTHVLYLAPLLFASILFSLLIEEELIIALLVVLVSVNNDWLVLRRSVRLPQ